MKKLKGINNKFVDRAIEYQIKQNLLSNRANMVKNWAREGKTCMFLSSCYCFVLTAQISDLNIRGPMKCIVSWFAISHKFIYIDDFIDFPSVNCYKRSRRMAQ